MYSISRLTLYAMLSAIEDDLRRIINQHLYHLHIKDILPHDLAEKVNDRAIKEIGSPYVELSLREVCYYLDFGDLYKLLNNCKKEVPQEIAGHLKDNTPNFEKLVPIRNRVAHSRPLNIEDWPTVFDTADILLTQNKNIWESLATVSERIKRDPSFILGVKIPMADNIDIVRHNLPIPDFDETGFYGRREQLDRLVKLCLGPYPVITIVGEGGIGKTAIALKTAYELLSLEKQPFDAIIWASSKTTQLTPQEIVNIEGAIRDSLGMFQYMSHELGGVGSNSPLNELLDYLKQFKILLIIDNLETILDDRIRVFLEQLPSGSKVLITSRIGLGAFEFPLKLEQMNEDDSTRLIRALARIRGIDSLYKLPTKVLRNYCNRMNNNPGFIKWFVSAIQTGSRPEDIFANSGIFLDFCMSNVYKYLSKNAKELIKTMFVSPGKHTQAELAFLTELEVLELQKSIHEALRTNMVVTSSEFFGMSLETSYELSDLARQYVNKNLSISTSEQENVIKKKRQLVAAQESIASENKVDPYSFYNIQIRSKSDLVVVKYLFDALKFAKENNLSKAKVLINEAKILSPEYYEVHRVDASIKTQDGNISGAKLSYETALELEPSSAPLLKWFGDFTLKYLGNTEGALALYKKAANIDPISGEIRASVARSNIYLQNYEEASKILEELSETQNGMEKLSRKVLDLSLQCSYRWSEKIYQDHPFEALEKLERMTAKYETCSRSLIDNMTIEKLKKAQSVAQLIHNSSRDPNIREKALTLIKWFDHEYKVALDYQNSRSQGVILSLFPTHGFIKMRSGKTIFFHKSDLEVDKWNSLWIGDEVTFITGVNSNDPENRIKAFNVRLRNPKLN